MFDDQPNNQPAGGPPSNLPTEPDDIFAGVDKVESKPPISSPTEPNALAAGMLKPKESAPADKTTAFDPTAPSPSPSDLGGQTEFVGQAEVTVPASGNEKTPPGNVLADSYATKAPVIGKVVIAVVIFLAAGGAVWGGFWLYGKINNNSQQASEGQIIFFPENKTSNNAFGQNMDESEAIEKIDNTNGTDANNAIVTTNDVNQSILFGEQKDTDRDGLDDVYEYEIGTDPLDPDTDDDELKDGDEVIIWKTDPLNPDTDGDTYLDGSEVRNEYNPLGRGKLFNVPSSTPPQGEVGEN